MEDLILIHDFFSVYFRHVSFVDCPGHDILMATMLNGAAVMDAALLLIGIRGTRVLITRPNCSRTLIE